MAILFLTMVFSSGCDERDSDGASLMVTLIGAMIYSVDKVVDTTNKFTYDQHYEQQFKVDESQCHVTDIEKSEIHKKMSSIKLGMKRMEIEKALGLDTIKNRMVVIGMGSDLEKFKTIYYLGGHAGIEMEYNKFTDTIKGGPKLIGEYWSSIKYR